MYHASPGTLRTRPQGRSTRIWSKSTLARTLVLVVGLLLAVPGQAASIYFFPISPTENYGDPLNWTANPPALAPGLPTASDEIRFYDGVGAVSTYTVNFNGLSRTHLRATIGGPDVTWDLGSGSLNLTSTSTSEPSLEIGRDSSFGSSTSSVLTVLDGTVQTVNAGIGLASGQTAELNVDANATLNASNSIAVGGNINSSVGSGTINVTDGGQVDIDGTLKIWSNGTVNVDANSRIETDQLSIVAGGTMHNAGRGLLTSSPLANNGATLVKHSATVDGIDSKWLVDNELTVGVTTGDDNTLNIEGGGEVENQRGLIAAFPGSMGSVTVGAGSTWTNRGSLDVGGREDGSGGAGTLSVDDGGSVTVGDYLKVWDAGSVTTANSVQIGGQTVNPNIDGLQVLNDVTVSGTSAVLDSGAALVVLGDSTLDVHGGGTGRAAADSLIGANGGDNATVTVDGNNSHLEIDAGLTLGVVTGSTGNLNLRNGAVADIATSLDVGGLTANSDANGNVTVESGAKIDVGTALRVREKGNVDVSDGASVNVGAAMVTGAAANSGSLLKVSDGGTVTNTGGRITSDALEIVAGGTIDNAGGVVVSVQSRNFHASDGGTIGVGHSATVGGANANWDNNGGLFIGVVDGDDAMLNVSGGGKLMSLSAEIATNNPSTIGSVTVDGTNSQWIIDDNLDVGPRGNGTLRVTGGGEVTSTSGFVARSRESNGTVTVGDGISTSRLSTSGPFYVGGNVGAAGGTGILTVADGGIVEVTDTMKLWGGGAVSLTGGELTATTIDHTVGGTFDFTGGLLAVDSFLGDLDNLGGTLAPGNSPGTTSVTGNYSQLALASLEIEIDGLTAGLEYDQLLVSDTATLDGLLDVSLLTYTPSAGDFFDIILADMIFGDFASLNLPTLDGDLFWQTETITDPLGSDIYRLTAVPEPSSLVLLGLGALVCGAFLRSARHGRAAQGA